MIQVRHQYKRVARGEEWMKLLHILQELGVIRNLVHQTKLASDVSCTDGYWNVLYGAVEL